MSTLGVRHIFCAAGFFFGLLFFINLGMLTTSLKLDILSISQYSSPLHLLSISSSSLKVTLSIMSFRPPLDVTVLQTLLDLTSFPFLRALLDLVLWFLLDL